MICYWATNRIDPQNLLSTTLDVPLHLSSTEAEYMALSDCSYQLIWTSNLLSEIGFDIPTLDHSSEAPIQYKKRGPNTLTSDITMLGMQ